MTRVVSLLVLIVPFVLGTPLPATAEEWPPLEHFAEDVELAVIAQAVDVSDGVVTLELDEVIRGEVDKLERGDDERWTATRYEHGLDVSPAQRVVICYSAHNQPTPGRYERHNTAFPISDAGTVIYASTGEPQILELEALIDALRPAEDPENEGDD